jgi:hypothetical protein
MLLPFFLRSAKTSVAKSVALVIELVLVALSQGLDGLAVYSLVMGFTDTAISPILGFQNGVTFILNKKEASNPIATSWAPTSVAIGWVWVTLLLLAVFPLVWSLQDFGLEEHRNMAVWVFFARMFSLYMRSYALPLASFIQVKRGTPYIAVQAHMSYVVMTITQPILWFLLGIAGLVAAGVFTSVITVVYAHREFHREYKLTAPSWWRAKSLLKEGWWNWFICLMEEGSTPIRNYIASVYGAHGIAVLATYRVLRGPAIGLSKAMYDSVAHVVSRDGLAAVSRRDAAIMLGVACAPALVLIPLLGTPVMGMIGMAQSSPQYAVIMAVQFVTVGLGYHLLGGMVQGGKDGPKTEAKNSLIATWLTAFPVGLVVGRLYPNDMEYFGLGYYVSALVLALLHYRSLRK